ncbi:MAG: hypothetical protein JXR96_10110 [Deltaproteobacteria bacterium]|nr:hypothetical protein [Deltaproteobacteria bacterium]
MKIERKPNPIQKRAARGFRGYPVASVAYYGPDDQRATKVAVGIVPFEGAEPIALERWYGEDEDIRRDKEITDQIIAFIREHDVRSFALADRIIGCPHEEGIDYPDGEECPECPFWHGRDRFTGKLIH